VRILAAWIVRLESFCFDLWHKVETRATAIDFAGKLDTSRGFWYLPTRPRVIRRVLRDVPSQNNSETVFIDFGSGKGRVLLLAAEHGYKKIIGIELRPSLHEIARQNLARCKHFPQSIHHIELLNADALDYEFPDRPLVLYFFNPFGNEVLRQILSKLQLSLDQNRRDVLLAMVSSEFDELMTSSFPQFELIDRSRLRSIYRHNPSEAR